MKSKFLLISILLMASAVLSACAGGAGVASSWPGLAVSDDTAFVAYNTQVIAVQLSNGIERWRFPEKPDAKKSFYAAPTLTPDGQLIVGDYKYVLYSLDPRTGALNWEYSKARHHFIGSALATEKGIFAPNGDGKLYALDSSGNSLWMPFEAKNALWAKPVTDDECSCIYLSSMDHRLYALNPGNGAQIWQSEDLGGAIVGTPALSDNSLYVGTFGNEMLAINAQDGSLRWRVPTDGWVWSGPALSQGRLYFGDLSGSFYALDASDGHTLWQLKPEKLDGPIAGTPLVADGTIYLTTESGTLFALDLEGGIQWKQTVGGKLYTSPMSAGELILITPIETDNLLIALTKDGAQKWSFNPNPPK